MRDTHTVDGFALRQIGVVGTCEKAISVSSHNAFDVSIVDVKEEAFHLSGCMLWQCLEGLLMNDAVLQA